jgi:hypothetical protein
MRGFGVAHIGKNPQHFDPIFKCRGNSDNKMVGMINLFWFYIA